MDHHNRMLHEELRVLVEVSTDFTRGLNTVAARMRALKSCLEKPHAAGQRFGRVDRATSPIVFRRDRGTSISPHRFGPAPDNFKKESVDSSDQAVGDSAPVDVKQENSVVKVNEETSVSIDCSQNGTIAANPEEQVMEVSCGAAPSGGNSGAAAGFVEREPHQLDQHQANATAGPSFVTTSANGVCERYYIIVNTANGALAVPVDTSHFDFGLIKNSIEHMVTLEHRPPLEEDILYAMQENQNKKAIDIDACSTVGTVGALSSPDGCGGTKILSSSKKLNELEVSEKVFSASSTPLNSSTVKKRPYNRRRTKNYNILRQSVIDADTADVANNPVNDIVKNVLNNNREVVSPNILTLRKDLVKRTYAREHQRDTETS